MTDERFDELTRRLESATSRRGLLQGALAVALGGVATRLRGSGNAAARARVIIACARLGQPCDTIKGTPGNTICCPDLACEADKTCCKPANATCLDDGDCCGTGGIVCRPNPHGLGERCLPPGGFRAACLEDGDCASNVCNPAAHVCACPDGGLPDLQTDPHNCGSCLHICDDGNPCTSNTCVAGQCAFPLIPCQPLDQCHVPGVCDPQTGLCSNPNKGDGAQCSDGNACSLNDTCQSGVCVPGADVVCQPLDQCHVAGVCDPQTGLCANPAAQNQTACEDGNACTIGDTCQAGVCQPGAAIVCVALDQCHDSGVCDPQSGICSDPPKGDGTPCTDGNLCTIDDTCQSGACQPGAPKACAPCEVCVSGTCQPLCGLADSCCSGQCANVHTDTFNCGACGHVCGSNEICCRAACVNRDQFLSDVKNCGRCGRACGDGLRCCDGSCVDTTDDDGNCGNCGAICSAGTTCINSACVSGQCKGNLSACNNDSDCCTSVCFEGVCICLPTPLPCTVDKECCTTVCEGLCICLPVGIPCSDDRECCTNNCRDFLIGSFCSV